MGTTEELQNSQEEKPQQVDVAESNDAEKSVETSPSSPSSGTPVNSEDLEPVVTLKTWIVTIVSSVSTTSSKYSASSFCLLTMLPDSILGIWSFVLAGSCHVGHWNPSRNRIPRTDKVCVVCAGTKQPLPFNCL